MLFAQGQTQGEGLRQAGFEDFLGRRLNVVLDALQLDKRG